MIAALLFFAQQAAVARGVVVDAATGAPVAAASVDAAVARATTDASGRFAIAASPGDTLYVRRVGYHPAAAVVGDTALVVPLASAAVALSPVRVETRREVGRLTAIRPVAELAREGVVDTETAVASLPFVSARSGRSGLALSLRGARAEQVVVTLDGMPLNDPATGWADLGGLPLTALGTVGAIPGTGVIAAGSGASGGVVALSSGVGTTLTAWAGDHGARGIEGAASSELRGSVVRLGAGWMRATNDFSFLNTVTEPDTVERRVNNDERRVALFGSWITPGAQLVALTSATERGLVGPMNVATYDRARERAWRALIRASVDIGRWRIAGGGRVLDFAYRQNDGGSPSKADADARSVVGDVEAARALGSVAVRVGAGFDRVAATALRTETRARGFGSAVREWSAGDWRVAAASRVDAVGDGGVHLSPMLAVERRGAFIVHARVGQGFRAPTFYDLYFASPQRIVPRGVEPERVRLDAELGARYEGNAVSLAGALFERRTRDAIVWFPGTFQWSPQNVPHERVRGAEARLTAEGAHLRVEAWGGVYETRLFVDGTVVPTPYVPRATGGATVGARVHRVELVLHGTAVGRRPFAVAPRDRRLELPGVVTADAVLSWRLPVRGAQALVVAGVHNIADVAWQSVVGYPEPGRRWRLGVHLRSE